jgi:thioester reductase-like protein
VNHSPLTDSLTANNPLATSTHTSLRSDLRQFARKHLPAAMVPARFIVLDALPKLPNGKVDRNRLPAVPDVENERAQLAASAFCPARTPDELQLVQIWRDLLGTERIGINDSFFDLGGNSLTAVQMVARVRETFDAKISLRELFEKPTIAALTSMLNVARTGVQAYDPGGRSMDSAALSDEARLPDDIRPDPAAAAGAYRRILLTGGTGYTGAFLLRELLDRSDAVIDVLARATDADQALERVRQNMAQYGVWRDTDAARLSGVAGDIGKPWFGLAPDSYWELAEGVDLVVHNGALSNYAQTYWQLKPVNVLGTMEVLRFACRRRNKPVHYISSLAVFPVRRGAHRFHETELDSPAGVLGGYQQTKWVADRLVMTAARRGIQATVYRPGQICGAQSSGAASTDTFLNAVLKGCIQVRAALPFDITLEMVPVDFCAAAVAHIALSGRHHGKVFHLTGARTLHWDEVMNLVRACGYTLAEVDYATWHRAVLGAVERGEENELAKYLMLFAERAPALDVGETGAAPSFDTAGLRSALAGSGIACAPLDEPLMATYLNYFRGNGYLPAP